MTTVCYAVSWALQGEPGLLVTGPKGQSAQDCCHRVPRLGSLSSRCSPLALEARNTVYSAGMFRQHTFLLRPNMRTWQGRGDDRDGGSLDGHQCHH